MSLNMITKKEIIKRGNTEVSKGKEEGERHLVNPNGIRKGANSTTAGWSTP